MKYDKSTAVVAVSDSRKHLQLLKKVKAIKHT